MVDLGLTSVFYEVAGILVLASALGIVGMALRQPLIVTFIAVGVIAGPSVFGLSQSVEHIELLSQLGVSILLFLGR